MSPAASIADARPTEGTPPAPSPAPRCGRAGSSCPRTPTAPARRCSPRRTRGRSALGARPLLDHAVEGVAAAAARRYLDRARREPRRLRRPAQLGSGGGATAAAPRVDLVLHLRHGGAASAEASAFGMSGAVGAAQSHGDAKMLFIVAMCRGHEDATGMARSSCRSLASAGGAGLAARCAAHYVAHGRAGSARSSPSPRTTRPTLRATALWRRSSRRSRAGKFRRPSSSSRRMRRRSPLLSAPPARAIPASRCETTTQTRQITTRGCSRLRTENCLRRSSPDSTSSRTSRTTSSSRGRTSSRGRATTRRSRGTARRRARAGAAASTGCTATTRAA